MNSKQQSCMACLLLLRPQGERGPETFKAPSNNTSDPISAICASESVLMVGRASGVVHRYFLPHLTPEGQHVLRCRPQVGREGFVGYLRRRGALYGSRVQQRLRFMMASGTQTVTVLAR